MRAHMAGSSWTQTFRGIGMLGDGGGDFVRRQG